MQPVSLSTPHGTHVGVRATSFLDRLAGIAAAGSAGFVIIPGSSVHGLWIRRPLDVTGVLPDGTALETRRLNPRRAVGFPGAAWILERRPGAVLLARGDRVAVTDLPG